MKPVVGHGLGQGRLTHDLLMVMTFFLVCWYLLRIAGHHWIMRKRPGRTNPTTSDAHAHKKAKAAVRLLFL